MVLTIELQNEGDLYGMCKSQFAQIDCRITECKFQSKGQCTNVSPAFTFTQDDVGYMTTTCWSKNLTPKTE